MPTLRSHSKDGTEADTDPPPPPSNVTELIPDSSQETDSLPNGLKPVDRAHQDGTGAGVGGVSHPTPDETGPRSAVPTSPIVLSGALNSSLQMSNLSEDPSVPELPEETVKALRKNAVRPDYTGVEHTAVWERSMRNYLAVHSLSHFIDVPPPRNASSQWKSGSAQVYVLLEASLGASHKAAGLGHVKNDAYSLWITILAYGASTIRARRANLMSSLDQIKMSSSDPLDAYLSRFDDIRVGLDDLGVVLEPATLNLYLYRGLSPTFQHHMDAIAADDLGYIDLIAKLRLFAARSAFVTSQTSSTSATLLMQESFTGRCYGCQEMGHKKPNCPKANGLGKSNSGNRKGQKKRFTGKCNYCHIKGHREVECRKKQREKGTAPAVVNAMVTQPAFGHAPSPGMGFGYPGPSSPSPVMMINGMCYVPAAVSPPPAPAAASPNTLPILKLTTTSLHALVDQDTGSVLAPDAKSVDKDALDGGAKRSVCWDRSRFRSYHSLTGADRVELSGFSGTRSGIFAIGEGEIVIHLSQSCSITLSAVLHVPNGIYCNIFSERDVMAAGVGIDKNPFSGAYLYHPPTRDLICRLDDDTALWYFPRIRSPVSSTTVSTTTPVSPAVFHARCGHASMPAVRSAAEAASDSVALTPGALPFCAPCAATRCPRSSASQYATTGTDRPLALLSSDLQGPHTPSFQDGARFAQLILDVCTGVLFVQFLVLKSEAAQRLQQMILTLENACLSQGHKVSRVRIDNGEAKTNAFQRWLDNKGIQLELTFPYASFGNPVERHHRTLQESARTMLALAGLLLCFWTVAFRHAVQLRNRLPSAGRNGEIPYQMWYGRAPRFDHFYTFGCAVWFKILPVPGKLEPQARLGVYLGVDDSAAGILVWDITRRRLARSRDYRVQENVFPARVWVISPTVTPPTEAAIHASMFAGVPLLTADPSAAPVPSVDAAADAAAAAAAPTDAATDAPPPAADDAVAAAAADPPVAAAAAAPPVVSDLPVSGLGVGGAAGGSAPDFPSLRRSGRHVAAPSRLIEVFLASDVSASPDSLLPTGGESTSPAPSTAGPPVFSTSPRAVPNSYAQIPDTDDPDGWLAAHTREHTAHATAPTWVEEIVDISTPTIGLVNLFSEKQLPPPATSMKKVRTVALGNQQRAGSSFDPTALYAPTVGMASMLLVMAVCAELLVCPDAVYEMGFETLDVVTAYLNAPLAEVVYARPLPEMKISGSAGPGQKVVLRLLRCLYGLKQAAAGWNTLISAFLLALGFVASRVDPCVFILRTGPHLTLVLLYVDDVILCGTSPAQRARIRAALCGRFQMKVLGPLTHFIGFEFSVRRDSIKVSQQYYASQLLEEMSQLGALVPQTTPGAHGTQLSKSDCPAPGSDEHLDMRQSGYSSHVAKFGWLNWTRPDISYSVSSLKRFVAAPGRPHLAALSRLAGYVQAHRDLGLVYRASGTGSQVVLSAYTDAGFASQWRDGDTRSQSGAVIFLCGAPICFFSHKQTSSPCSTADTEMVALAACLRQILWLRVLLAELGFPQEEATVVYEDNSAVMSLAQNKGTANATKHIVVRENWVREAVARGEIRLQQIPSGDQLADMMTKWLPEQTHARHVQAMMG